MCGKKIKEVTIIYKKQVGVVVHGIKATRECGTL